MLPFYWFAALQHIWNSYVTWGLGNPEQRKVMNQLRVSDSLTEESKAAGYAPLPRFRAWPNRL